MNRSEQINEIIEALVEAQKEFKPVYKQNDNPAFRGSKYADLATVIGATQPALNKHGLVIVQGARCIAEQSITEIDTLLAHTSGQWISDILQLPATINNRFDPQSVGSSITYGRRYSWSAMCGVAPELDDDGNAASQQGSKEAAQKVAQEKLAIAKTVSVTFSPSDQMFVWGPGCALIDTVLKSSGTKNILGQWIITKKDGSDVLKALGEAGVEVKEEPYQEKVVHSAPVAAPETPMSARAVLPGEVDGTLVDIKELTGPKAKFFAVTIKTPMGQQVNASFFKNPKLELVTGDTVTLFHLLDENKGKPISVVIEVVGKHTNLTFVSRIAEHEFEQTDDGIIAIRQTRML